MTERQPAGLRPSPGRKLAGILITLFLLSPADLCSQSKPLPVRTVEIDGHAYVSIPNLASALSATTKYVPLKDKVILHRSKDPDLVFTLMSSVYLIGQVQFRLPYPTRILSGQLHASHEVLDQLRIPSNDPEAVSPEPSWPQEPRDQSYQPVMIPADRDKDRSQWSIDRVAIDPGHGGKDPGAVGKNKTHEKDITLAIAKRLGDRLEKELKIKVIYTRKRDVFVRLGSRARIARNADADMFVSLHCNAGRRRAAGGIEVYFLSAAKTAAAAEVAERENAALTFETKLEAQEDQSTLRGIALEILSAQYLKESQDLASSIRGRMTRRFKKMDDRGVKQANFYVLRGTMGFMPSVLVEMGFISNPTEEKLMKTGRFEKDMSDAIFEGIRNFKLEHERQISNTR